MKKTILTVIWIFVIYMGICVIAGGVVGAMAGMGHANDPDAARAAGQVAGAEFVGQYRIFIVLFAVIFGTVCSYYEILPGTKSKPQPVAD